MIEKMADAIEAAFHNDDDSRTHFKALALAVLKAMRDPSKEMVEPGYEAIHSAIDFYNYDSGSGYTVEPTGAADVWRAMIDAAIAEAKL